MGIYHHEIDHLHHFGLFVDLKHNRLIITATQLTVHGITAWMAIVSPTLLETSTTYHSAIQKEYLDIARPVFHNQPIKHDVTQHIKTSTLPVSS